MGSGFIWLKAGDLFAAMVPEFGAAAAAPRRGTRTWRARALWITLCRPLPRVRVHLSNAAGRRAAAFAPAVEPVEPGEPGAPVAGRRSPVAAHWSVVRRARRRGLSRRRPVPAGRRRFASGPGPALSRNISRSRRAARRDDASRSASRPSIARCRGFPSKQPESGERMKSIVSKAVAGMIVAALACGNAFAQASGAAAEASAPAAAQNASKAAAKTARKSNRKLGYAVRKAISKVNGVNVSNITVRTKGGVVTLEGSVPDASQIDKAVEAAKGVAGVVSVNNKLSVQPQ
ncbi:unnamed protein product [Burkholderia pseudomallei]|nr:transport-associated domain-containing protein [Burkholderia pseudomallei BPC006]VUD52922.1 unnamed protein product [Burkholderia pseudomallei]